MYDKTLSCIDLLTVRFGVAGHSLGGALATLAALDIKRKLPGLKLRVYTFGSPRTGNHAFAAEYIHQVCFTASKIYRYRASRRTVLRCNGQ